MVTHRYGEHAGVRYTQSGHKVLYLPRWPVIDQVSIPRVHRLFSQIFSLLRRERSASVRVHQATSGLSHEALWHARQETTSIYTDHSLFGQDLPARLLSSALALSLSQASASIGVSHACRANLIRRTGSVLRVKGGGGNI